MKKIYYLLMVEPTKQASYNTDTCKHKLIYDQEWVCSLCGRVFSEEEAEELQKGSAEVTSVRSLDSIGLDPHGRTPLWLHGLGSIEGYKHNSNNGERDDISILSNIADKLQLPSHIAVEFLQLYRSFVKEEKDKIPATKLALMLLTVKYPLLKERLKRLLNIQNNYMVTTDNEIVEYITMVVENNFNTTTSNSNSSNSGRRNRIRKKKGDRYLIAREGLLQCIVHIATIKGAKYAYNYVMEMV